MQKRRERHGRGLRGPLSLPNRLTGNAMPVRKPASNAEFFIDCIANSVEKIQLSCPQALAGVDVAVDEVPGEWGAIELESVPLAAALEADKNRPAKVILFRRPLERRANDRADLQYLTHRTLVEQLSALTLIAISDIDPDLEIN